MACPTASAVHKEAKSLGREAVRALFLGLEPPGMVGPFCDPVPLLSMQLGWSHPSCASDAV